MDNPRDRVTYGDLRLIRSELDDIMQLALDGNDPEPKKNGCRPPLSSRPPAESAPPFPRRPPKLSTPAG